MTVQITRFHLEPPSQAMGEEVIKLAGENVTDLSMLSVPPSNLLHEVYQWALPIEIGAYMSRIGQIEGEPVELLIALDDGLTESVVGFLLYSPVPTHSEACGVNYMAVRQSHRRRGVGSELMKRLIALYPHVELTCPVKKVPFYEPLGFQVLNTHIAQVVMNTRSASTTGLMATLDVRPIYESNDAKAIHHRLVQRWGHRAMAQAEKQLARHVDQLTRQAKGFVDGKLANRQA